MRAGMWIDWPPFQPPPRLELEDIDRLWCDNICELLWIGVMQFRLPMKTAEQIAFELWCALCAAARRKHESGVAGASINFYARQLVPFARRQEPAFLQTMSPRDFEVLIGEALSQRGMRVELTPASRDGGRDLIVRASTPLGELLHFIEAKRYDRDRPVGVATVRAVYGVVCDADATTGVIITTSRFTRAAREFAQRHPWRLQLIDRKSLIAWLTVPRPRATAIA